MEQRSNGNFRISAQFFYRSILSELRRDRFTLVALNDDASLVCAGVADLNAAFKPGTHFFHVILEAAQRRNPAVVHWLLFPEHARARGASYATIGHETAGDDASAQFKDLFHLGMSYYSFSMFRLEQARHRLFALIEQFVNDAVKLHLHTLAFRSGNRHVLNLHIEANHDGV